MKSMNSVKGLALALLIALTVLFLAQRSGTATSQAGTATPQAAQTVARYQIAAYEYNLSTPQGPTGAPAKVLFKFDNQSGDAWWFDTRSNKWIKVNN